MKEEYINNIIAAKVEALELLETGAVELVVDFDNDLWIDLKLDNHGAIFTIRLELPDETHSVRCVWTGEPEEDILHGVFCVLNKLDIEQLKAIDDTIKGK